MNLTEPQAGSDLGALEDPRRARRRRHLPHLRPEDLHHLWRARPHRQHHPSGAGPAARRAGRHARHLAVPGAEIPGQRRRLARARATTSFCHSHRAQARHPRLADLHDDLWRRQVRRRAGAIGWLVGEENHGLACMFTMMNNARLQCRHAGRRRSPKRPTRRRSPMPSERTPGPGAGLRPGEGMSPIVEHPDVARTLLTMKAPDAGRPRHLPMPAPTPSTWPRVSEGDAGASWQRARQPADADRQGVFDRYRRRGRLDRHPGPWRHGLHRGDRRRAAICATPASPRSTRAPTASRRSTWSRASCRCRAAMRSRPISPNCDAHRRAVRASNRPDFGATADAARSERWTTRDGDRTGCSNAQAWRRHGERALAGATPYLRLFGLPPGGAYLAKGGAGRAEPRARDALPASLPRTSSPKTDESAPRHRWRATSLATPPA